MSDPSQSVSDTSSPPKSKAFGHTYWMLNSIEAFERLAYFGIRSVVPIYIMQATEPGGLHMTAVHKGIIYAWWAIFQSWLPMFTGGVADRYGYKRVLVCAISMNVMGYLVMACTHSYYGFFAGVLVLATGTAFFKPALQGSIAQNLTKENASMGWGVFYWVVNIGAVTAPLLATVILGKPHSAEGWRNLFLASAVYTAMNLLLLLTFKDVPSGSDKTLSVFRVFWVTLENIWPYWFRGGTFDWARGLPGLVLSGCGLGVLIFGPFPYFGGWQWVLGVGFIVAGMLLVFWLRDGEFTWQLRLPAFLLIMSCFWMMMYQVWDLHPNFIEDWIDSSSVAQYAPEAWREYGDRGLLRVPQQILLTLNAFLIVLFVVPLSWLVRRMRTLSAMLIGMTVAIGGTLVAGLTDNGWILLSGITLFSLGEMLTGPKKNQYLGLIAPPGKKGLYLGYVNIPIGIGVGLGSLIAGFVYDHYGEKANLALKHLGANTELVSRAAQSSDWSDSLEKIPQLTGIDRSQAFELARQDLQQDAPTAAETLRRAFRYDRGQIVNLALQYLALDKEHREEATTGLAKLLLNAKNDPEANALGKRLENAEVTLDQIGVARFVHLIPKALGKKRFEVLGVIADHVNAGTDRETATEDSELIAMLWERLGDDAEVLNNLALEYLAQNTPLIHDAVADITFDDPIKEIKKKLGINRMKSFAVLAAAFGASEDEVDAALSEMQVSNSTGPDGAVYVYLANLPHRRFMVVAQKDWSKDLTLLRELIRKDEGALQIVRAEIDRETFFQRLFGAIKRVFGSEKEADEINEEGVNYHKLADNQNLIQKALDAKNWTESPVHAAKVLGLNPFEARALVAAEVNRSPLTTTHLLWNTYVPQYKVWIPFALIGIVAAIALAIFGQMAKKWGDMNA